MQMIISLQFLVCACLALASGLSASNMPVMNTLSLTVGEVSHQGRVVVTLKNSTGDPVKLWRDSNSWGAARWRVLRIRPEGVDLFYQDPNQDFTVNVPQTSELAGGATKREELDLNGEHWCGDGHCTSVGQRRSPADEIRFNPNDQVVVIYDIPFSPEALRLGVWYGVVAGGVKVR